MITDMALEHRDRPRCLSQRHVTPQDVHSYRRQYLLSHAAPVVERTVAQRMEDVLLMRGVQRSSPIRVLEALHNRRVRHALEFFRGHLGLDDSRDVLGVEGVP